MAQKNLYFIAGPNGAGKTTASLSLLPSLWECEEFVNADEIARGLSPFHPEEMAIQAGRIQLQRIDELLKKGVSFSVETTLASKTYRGLIQRAQALGYEVNLVFFYLPSADDAVERVRLRVLSGGHDIPEDVIRRRYEAGLRNLFSIYMPIVDSWEIVNNKINPPTKIASSNGVIKISDGPLFTLISERYGRK